MAASEQYPSKLQPRPGFNGVWDRLAGPGATPAETGLNMLWTLLCTGIVIAYALLIVRSWTILQLSVVGFFAFDIAGGISVNASPSAQRWWHRPGQRARHHLTFVLLHIHPFVLAWLFPSFGWGSAAGIYAYLLLASAVILATAPRLRHPVAFILYSIAILLTLYVWPRVPGLEWFVPFYFLKLLLAHLLGPRPSAETSPPISHP